MTIARSQKDGIEILRLEGTFLGRPDVSLFEESMFQLLHHDKIRIILDVEGLKMVDSAGLGSMISAMISVQRKGGGLCLAHVGGEVARVVKSMQLHRVFVVYDTVEDAVAGFR